MPTITSFAGEKLLEPATIAEIKNQTETLLKNKDVAGAFQAAAYLKAELAKLPADKVKPVLDIYRAVTANLKVLALPLLENEEVKNLLANNLPFVDAAFSDALPPALSAWLSLQPEAEAAKTKEELLAVLPVGNPLSDKIKTVVVSTPPPLARGGVKGGGRDPLSVGTASTRGPSPSSALGGLGIGTTISVPRNDIKKDELFDDDEASELANHAAKVNEMGGSPLPTDGAARLADEILSLRPASPAATGGSLQTRPEPPEGRRGDDKGQVQDADGFKRRAQALVVSRLRDVRTTAEIREYLGRPFAVGGLGLSADALEKALKLIEQEYQKLHASGPGKATVQGPQPTASPAPEAGVKSQTATGPQSQGVNGQDEGKHASSAVSEAASPPVIPNPAQRGEESPLADKPRSLVVPLGGTPRDDNAKSARSDKSEADVIQVVKAGAEPLPAAQAASPRVTRPAQTSGSDKPRLDDIKRPTPAPSAEPPFPASPPVSSAPASQPLSTAQTVGAPDELKLLTLPDFRSFGGGPAAVNHILEKVNILAKESLSEKMAALAAFRESPLFREYVNIGRAALGSGRKLAEALADAALNSNKMTEDEFFAIAELNGKLK